MSAEMEFAMLLKIASKIQILAETENVTSRPALMDALKALLCLEKMTKPVFLQKYAMEVEIASLVLA